MMRPTFVSIARRGPLAITGTLVLVLGMAVVHTNQRRSHESSSIDAALLRHGVGAGHPRSDVIVYWNSVGHDLAVAEDQFLTFKGQRALAMMHLAMHDALNAIVPVYEAFAYSVGHHLA